MKYKPNLYLDFSFHSPPLFSPQANEAVFRAKGYRTGLQIAQRRSSCLSLEREKKVLSTSSRADDGSSFNRGDHAA